MAAVGAEVAGLCFLSPGVITFFMVLLLLSIFLTALCSNCRRHSFELRDSQVDKDPSGLIRVVKLEEAVGPRENPMINEIQNDEKDVQTNGSAAVIKTTSESAEEENPVSFTPWRSHLGAPQIQGMNGSAPPDSDHIYHTIGGGRDVSSIQTNRAPGEDSSDRDRNSIYAQVSKKVRSTTPTVQEVQVEVEEEEFSPPLPNRKLEG